MYEKLNQYLSNSSLGDYWYDEGNLIATDIFKQFSESDWQKLLDDISSKSIEWQIQFAYCAPEINNEFLIKSLILLASIDNDELFKTCIDTLRVTINFDNKLIISSDKVMLERIEKILEKCDNATQIVFEDFVAKL